MPHRLSHPLVVLLAVALLAPAPARAAPDAVGAAFAVFAQGHEILFAHALHPPDPLAVSRASYGAIERAARAAKVSAPPVRLAGDPAADRAALGRAFRAVAARADPRALAWAMLDAALAVLDDRYSYHLAPAAYARLAQRNAGAAYGGIGVTVGFDGPVPVVTATLDGPARGEGVRRGDRILEIDGVGTRGLDATQVIDRLRGAPGTIVRLRVQRPGAPPRSLAVTRAIVQERPVASAMLDGAFAHLAITAFTERGATEAQRHLAALLARSPRGLVLDLRDNGGGSVFAALVVASSFLDRGPVAYLAGAGGRQLAYPWIPNTIRVRVPVAVVVNAHTASSAELVAGALQDAGLPLVGGRTYGKGLVQSLFRLADGSAIKLTTGEYRTPAGRPVHGVGLAPDVRAADEGALARAVAVLLEGRRAGDR